MAAASDSDRPSGVSAVAAAPLRVPSSSSGAAPHDSPRELRYCNFEDFIQHLGIDQSADKSGLVTAAAQHMFAAQLPPQWSEQIDESSSRVYFFNRATGESLWMHPQEAIFKELMEEVKSWQTDESMEDILASADAHLRRAQRSAVEALEQWSAYDAPQGPEEAPEFGESPQFFFNASTGESSWADPRQSVEFDLRQRHAILGECISDRGMLASPSDSSDGENSSQLDQPRPIRQQPADRAKAQSFVQNLGDLLGTLSLPLRQVAGPPDAMPHVALRPLGLPAGDDTVRSSMSYLTARSNASCGEEARGGDLSARQLL